MTSCNTHYFINNLITLETLIMKHILEAQICTNEDFFMRAIYDRIKNLKFGLSFTAPQFESSKIKFKIRHSVIFIFLYNRYYICYLK